jgi:hypothetical protein
MWIVEVNVLGRRYTLRINHRPEVSRPSPRMTHWRQWKQRHPRAAA